MSNVYGQKCLFCQILTIQHEKDFNLKIHASLVLIFGAKFSSVFFKLPFASLMNETCAVRFFFTPFDFWLVQFVRQSDEC